VKGEILKRKVITINEEKCNGCELCIPNCPEGALQIIDGKARLISDRFCDGLGACLGHCPEGAIIVEDREAEPYDERTVMENIIKQGPKVILAHLRHLQDHGETELLGTAAAVLREKKLPNPLTHSPKEDHMHSHAQGGCPGSKIIDFAEKTGFTAEMAGTRPSALRQWPVQMHLISPNAPYFKAKDLLLAADCVAFAMGDFHKDYLSGRSLAIACPKLDEGQDVYKDKIKALIDEAKVNTITVMIMQVPCCGGLLQLVQEAAAETTRKVPIKAIVVSLQGEILKEEWA
jgi:NAD-dependent dihydropyrimidine dehydrogenase PreA subunit